MEGQGSGKYVEKKLKRNIKIEERNQHHLIRIEGTKKKENLRN